MESSVTERAETCLLMMKSLRRMVEGFAPHQGEFFQAGYKTEKNSQQNKTAIRRQVTALRQELLALEKEVTK